MHSVTPIRAADGPLDTAPLPLCVDLDGTLVATDTLVEGALALARHRPASLLRVPLWLLRGRAYLKQRIAAEVPLPVSLLPYQPDLLEYLRREHASGRELVLATAADREVAHGVALHLGLFHTVLASDGRTNLSGSRKRQALIDRFGRGNFDYAANSYVDLPVWREAAGAILVDTPPGLAHRVRGERVEVREVFTRRSPAWRAWLRAVRVHQWPKNLLVFVPLLVGHHIDDPTAVGHAAIGFVAFTLGAASVYLLNDLLDLEADRRHATKHRRPFAAGDLPVLAGLLAVPVLAAASLGLSLALLPARFSLVLGTYLTLTVAYTFALKRMLLVDVIALAGLYMLRVLAGGQATGITISMWTLAFSAFLFLSLALVKRFAELQRSPEAPHGRGYWPSDLTPVAIQGIASGYAAVLTLALYINSPEVRLLYSEPHWLWLLCFVLVYWISRVWVLAYRQQMNEDPVLFALRDKASYVLAALTLAILYWAS